MLLRALANARATDGSAVSELLAAVRDPLRRGEAISMGADLASEFLAEPEAEKLQQEVGEALEELQAVEETIVETAEETLVALDAIEGSSDDQDEETEPAPEPAPEPEVETAEEVEETQDLESEPEPEPELAPEPEAIPEPEPPPPPPPAPVVDWSRWQSATESSRPAPMPRPDLRPSVADVGTRRFEAKAVMGAMGAAQSVLSQLRVLHRELSGFKGSSVATLRELIEAFPDGWARRRALCALLEEEIPSDASDALELISCLGRDLDRRWCLGLLARRGVLHGSVLTRALDLVDSPFGKRRLAAVAG
jgi:outer membrane biosynthesis protein TonB